MLQWGVLALVLVASVTACGGSGGGSAKEEAATVPPTQTLEIPDLGAFPFPTPIKKLVTDPAFELVPPTSNSPGAFSFSSSNPAVASISGNKVTIHSKGRTTIAVAQASSGKFAGTAALAEMFVLPRLDGFVEFGGLLWSPNTQTMNWEDAKTYCAGTIDGQTGWRLPTTGELTALAVANAMDGNDWYIMQTWTSDSAAPGNVNGIHLGEDRLSIFNGTEMFAVTCVK